MVGKIIVHVIINTILIKKKKCGTFNFTCLHCGSYHSGAYVVTGKNGTLTCTANHFSKTSGWVDTYGVGFRWSEGDSVSTGVWYTSSVKHSTYISSYYMNCGLEEKESNFTSIDFVKN